MEDAAAGFTTGVEPTLLRTRLDKRTRLTPESVRALRMLARHGARSGQLSPLSYNLTISHRHRFVWFRVAKVATRTVFDHFDRAGLRPEVERAFKMRYPTALFADYFRFAFVRHPLDRFVSAWQDKVVLRNYYGFDPPILEQMQRIERFAAWTATHDLRDLDSVDQHVALQSRLVDLTQIDFLGRLENFDADFATICDRIGLAAPSGRRVHAAPPGGLRPDTVSVDLVSTVEELYRPDYQIFGY